MDDLIYLDNAATSWPKPDNVYNFMVDTYRDCGVNPGRSGFDKAIEAGDIVEQLRSRLSVAAIDWSRRFTWDRAAEVMARAVDDALASRPRGSRAPAAPPARDD